MNNRTTRPSHVQSGKCPPLVQIGKLPATCLPPGHPDRPWAGRQASPAEVARLVLDGCTQAEGRTYTAREELAAGRRLRGDLARAGE